jgi:hypothetical protein
MQPNTMKQLRAQLGDTPAARLRAELNQKKAM